MAMAVHTRIGRNRLRILVNTPAWPGFFQPSLLLPPLSSYSLHPSFVLKDNLFVVFRPFVKEASS
jgi:hypothetical protein